MFDKLLAHRNDGVTFVSLQYGNVKKDVDLWSKMDCRIIYDPDVDPLIDMDTWLDQVAACDAVISAANTTIHGAGGLGLPTMCLLSKDADWRWLNDSQVSRSYWYPSVGILSEKHNSGWTNVLKRSVQWVDSGCPMPSGRAFIKEES